MQYLYALERHKEAYQQMGREKACSHFDPDLNAPEAPDLVELNRQKEETGKAFDIYFEDQQTSPTDAEIKDAVTDGYAQYENLVKDAQQIGFDDLMKESDSIADSYIKILILPTLWKDLIVEEWNRAVGQGKSMGTGFRNLASNPVLKSVEDHTGIATAVKKKKIGWDTETISDWLRKIVRKDEAYQEYSENAKPTPEDHTQILSYLFKKIIFKNDQIDGYLEENDLSWSENRSILKSMIVKTLKTYDDSKASIELINLSPNWKEDKEFYKKLYLETVANDEKLEEIIASKSKNWDVERIAAIDMVIMKMAITEFLQFPSIPVKVTINEYIEICKSYSTPKSKQYVNGILDVLSTELMGDGSIKKSGRGLLDNK